MRPIYLAVFLCLNTGVATAQDAIDRCTGLLDAELIDRSSTSEVRQISESEFNSLCSQEGSLSQAYENSSFGLQGGLRRYGASLGISYDEASGSREEWMRNVCDQGSRDFAEFMARESQSSSGAFVTEQYNACVATLVGAGQSFLTGELLETGVVERFTVLFRYEAGRDGPRTVELAGLSGDPVVCVGGVGEDPIGPDSGISFSGERSITCELPEGQTAAGGTFRFTSPNGPSREVPYSYVARDLVAEMEARIAADYAARVEAAVPAGQVSMFALAQCPAGWRLHEGLAAGRVAVGATGGIGGEVGSAEVLIPREALPREALRLPTIRGETPPRDPAGGYIPDTNPWAVQAAGGLGNYLGDVRFTEHLGAGAALDLPTPPGIALLPCVRL